MLIYCDSAILIYFLDHVGPLQVRAANRLAALRASGDQVAVSSLVRMECRVLPIRLGDLTRLAQFDIFFGQPDVQKVPLSDAVFDRATAIRAKHSFKTIDSINLAAAVESGCARFLTNDYQLTRFTDVAVEMLP
jgi:predicted nucleic acid-binding protein